MHRALLILATILVPTVVLSQPHLELVPTSLDFGSLKQQETRDACVELTNTGDATITIRRVETTCGCMVPELDMQELAPGQCTEMRVQFNSERFQGYQLKFIKIYTDSPRQRVIDYQIQANIMVPLYMEPAQSLLRYPAINRGETHTLTYTFRSEEVAELEITPTAWPEDWLDVVVKPGRTPQSKVVDFTIRAGSPTGTYRELIKLRTNVDATPVVNLEADVLIAGDLILKPERVRLNRVRPGQTLNARIEVHSASSDLAFELTQATIDIPGMEVALESSRRGKPIAVLSGIAMALDSPTATESKGRIKGTLTIHTNLESTPVLTVPVTYMLRR